MKHLTKFLIAVFFLGMTGLTRAEVSYFKPSSKTGASLCVVVKDDVLAHTSQILPLNIKGGMITSTGVGDQTALVLKNLDYLLKKVDCSLNKLVKLNIYVAREEL